MEDRQSSRLISFVRNFFFSKFNKEFLIFLFFLFLSGAFWFVMTMSENYEREIKVPIRLENIPRKVVVTTDLDDTVRVTVRDRGYILLSYMYGNNLHPIQVNFNTYNKGNGKGSMTASEMTKQLYQNMFKSTKITSVKPDKFEFLYNYGDSKQLKVKLNGKITPGHSYYLASVKFSPSVVTVYANKEKLDSMKSILTELVRLNNVTDTIIREVDLAKEVGMKCIPSKVTLSVFPDVLTEESVEVPIVAVNMPEGKILRTFPSRVKVNFTTGVSQFRNIRPELFRVEVDYWEIHAHPSDKCTVHVQSTPSGVRNVRTDPATVDYLIESQ